MLKRIKNLFIQDWKLTVRNWFLYVVIILTIVYGSLMLFAFPEELKIGLKEVVFDKSEQFELFTSKIPQEKIINTQQEFDKFLNDNPDSIGIILDRTIQDPKVTIVHQGTENMKNLRLLEAVLDQSLKGFAGRKLNEDIQVTFSRKQSEKVPFNKSLLPVFLATEVIMFGFMIIAIMILEEKKLGTLKAYRVSPGGAFEYVFSKTLVNLILSVIFGVLLTSMVVGIDINWLALLSLIIPASIIMTLLGIWISSYFRDFEAFIFGAVGIVFLLGLPMFSYFIPTFYIKIFEYIPMYPVLFGSREILFPTGKTGFLLPMLIKLLVEIVVVYGFTVFTVSRQLLRAGR